MTCFFIDKISGKKTICDIVYYMKSYSMIGKWSNFKYIFLSFLNVNKYKLIFISFFILVGLLTGIFTAVKYTDCYDSINFNDFLLKSFSQGKIATWDLFFERFISCACFSLLLFLCSFAPFLFPIGVFVLIYRSYLLGLNIAFIVLIYGLGSIFNAIIIIFPLQLLMIILAGIFFCLFRNRCNNKKKFGKISGLNIVLLYLILILLLTIVNLVETLLLILFSAQIILVI